MDQNFVFITTISEGKAIAISLMLAILGGMLAFIYADITKPMRRVKYLWCIALLNVALSALQFSWAMIPAATEAGQLWLLVCLNYAGLVLFGGGLFYASAARARDVCWEPDRGWLGFIPIANLVLLLKKGRCGPARETRAWLSRALDPISVIAALFLFGLSQSVWKVFENVPLYNASDSPKLLALLAETTTVEENFSREADLTYRQLPKRLDYMTIWTHIEAEGKTLRIYHDVEQQVEIPHTFKATIAEQQCAPNMFGMDIRRGGAVEMIYTGPNGANLASFRITNEDCV